MGGNVSENSVDIAISPLWVKTFVYKSRCFAGKTIMERFLTTKEDYSIYESDEDVLSELAEFVVEENYRHHSVLNTDIPSAEVERVFNEERRLINLSHILVARNKTGEIVGSIRITKWDRKTELPMETLFGLNPLDLAISTIVTTFWHIGRFSIRKDSQYSTILLMKILMIHAIYPIVKEVTGCLLAEVDRKLFNVLGKLGIAVSQLAPSINYLASETIPIYSTSEAMLEFYNRNKHLYTPLEFNTLMGENIQIPNPLEY